MIKVINKYRVRFKTTVLCNKTLFHKVLLHKTNLASYAPFFEDNWKFSIWFSLMPNYAFDQ